MEHSNKDSKPTEIDIINPVPWRVYEKTIVLNEARERRKDIIIIILILLLVISNALWLRYLRTIEFVEESTEIEAEQDGSGVNIVGGGDIDYGTESEDNSETQSSKQ